PCQRQIAVVAPLPRCEGDGTTADHPGGGSAQGATRGAPSARSPPGVVQPTTDVNRLPPFRAVTPWSRARLRNLRGGACGPLGEHPVNCRWTSPQPVHSRPVRRAVRPTRVGTNDGCALNERR